MEQIRWIDFWVYCPLKSHNWVQLNHKTGMFLLPYPHGFLIVVPEKVVRLVCFDSFSPVNTQVKHCTINKKQEIVIL